MRVYPGVLTVRDAARWLCASPTTERASTVLLLVGSGLALSATCWGLARRVSNLVLAPRTFGEVGADADGLEREQRRLVSGSS